MNMPKVVTNEPADTAVTIKFEGVAGAGKTTLINRIQEQAETLGLKVLQLREETNELVVAVDTSRGQEAKEAQA